MSQGENPDVVAKRIRVRCPLAVAFEVWTAQIDRWWPKGHSRSGDPATRVFLEGRVGGRLYERSSDGVEHPWGEVIAWEPPRLLVYDWFLGSSSTLPTRVEVRFSADGPGHTLIAVTHRGPELVGELWARTSHRFTAAWEHVLEAYATGLQTQEEETP